MDDDVSDEYMMRNMNRFLMDEPTFSKRFPQYYNPTDELITKDRHMNFIDDRRDHNNPIDAFANLPFQIRPVDTDKSNFLALRFCHQATVSFKKQKILNEKARFLIKILHMRLVG